MVLIRDKFSMRISGASLAGKSNLGSAVPANSRKKHSLPFSQERQSAVRKIVAPGRKAVRFPKLNLWIGAAIGT